VEGRGSRSGFPESCPGPERWGGRLCWYWRPLRRFMVAVSGKWEKWEAGIEGKKLSSGDRGRGRLSDGITRQKGLLMGRKRGEERAVEGGKSEQNPLGPFHPRPDFSLGGKKRKKGPCVAGRRSEGAGSRQFSRGAGTPGDAGHGCFRITDRSDPGPGIFAKELYDRGTLPGFEPTPYRLNGRSPSPLDGRGA